MTLPSYLFGTIHLDVDKMWKHLPVEIKLAFNHSSLIVLEMHESDGAIVAQSLLKHATLGKGKRLHDVVSKEVYTNANEYIMKHVREKIMNGTFTDVDLLLSLHILKPYWVATLLEQSMTGAGNSATLDDTLAVKALEMEKEVSGIVTPDEQLSINNWYDEDGYGEYVLNYTVNMLKEDKEFSDKSNELVLIKYLCGPLLEIISEVSVEDDNGLAYRFNRLASQQFHEKFMEEMLLKRNRLWLPRIDHILRTQSQVFFAFGAAHMIGEESVVELLQQHGYTVTLYTNDDNGIILPVSNGTIPDRLSFDFFANDFRSPSGVKYSGVKSRSLSAGLRNGASSMMILCLFLITVWIF
ncbi:traB family domain-containing protein [Ditylenchus destructor]|nr:traB family domain-containing protein [Ditylenchus destructor]